MASAPWRELQREIERQSKIAKRMPMDKWSGIPDSIRTKPRIKRLQGQWVVDMGNLGHVPMLFGCGPEWSDVLTWRGWEPLDS